MTKLIVMDGVNLDNRMVIFSNLNAQTAIVVVSEEVKRIAERFDRKWASLRDAVDHIQHTLNDGDITITKNSIMLTTYKVSGDGEIPHTVRILNYQ